MRVQIYCSNQMTQAMLFRKRAEVKNGATWKKTLPEVLNPKTTGKSMVQAEANLPDNGNGLIILSYQRTNIPPKLPSITFQIKLENGKCKVDSVPSDEKYLNAKVVIDSEGYNQIIFNLKGDES